MTRQSRKGSVRRIPGLYSLSSNPFGSRSASMPSRWTADVVQVDVDGQARDVEPEEVERRPALEGHSLLQKRMAANGLQQLQEKDHLLERFRLEARSGSFARELVCGEAHATSAHVRPRTSCGTMRFHAATSLPGLRRASRYRGCRGRRRRSWSRCLSSTISASRCCSRKNPTRAAVSADPSFTAYKATASRSKNSTISSERQTSSQPPAYDGTSSTSTRVRSRVVARTMPPAWR